MPTRRWVRFALEVAFLIAAAAAAGFAELDAVWIVAVMAIAWLFVALIEWAAWRDSPRFVLSRAASPWPPAIPPAARPPVAPASSGAEPVELAAVPVPAAPLLEDEGALAHAPQESEAAVASAAAGTSDAAGSATQATSGVARRWRRWRHGTPEQSDSPAAQ